MSAVQQAEHRTGEPFRETTTPLLRPHQVRQLEESADSIQQAISAHSQFQIGEFDVGAARARLNRVKRNLETQMPRPYSPDEVDAAVKRERELVEFITNGMPTQAEMRRNPPGATDKHRRWMRQKKSAVLELKNIRLRKHATDMTEADIDGAADIANIESLRPSGGASELSMDNSQITGREFFGPPVPSSVVMNDTEISALHQVDPELAGQLSVLPTEARIQIKQVIQEALSASRQPQEGQVNAEAEIRPDAETGQEAQGDDAEGQEADDTAKGAITPPLFGSDPDLE